MAPVNYMKHCSACHPLLFDERFKSPAPHKKPEIVHQFLIDRYTQYISENPGELGKAKASVQPNRPVVPAPRTAAKWVPQQVTEAERKLWRETCAECHKVSDPPGALLPVVAPAQITQRWLPHAFFNHEAHQMLSCTSCHIRVTESELTSDVLLPHISACQQCHREDRQEAAEARCFECHSYHDWNKQKRIKGRTTRELLGKVTGSAPATPWGNSSPTGLANSANWLNEESWNNFSCQPRPRFCSSSVGASVLPRWNRNEGTNDVRPLSTNSVDSHEINEVLGRNQIQ
jgi:hypothetical protein